MRIISSLLSLRLKRLLSITIVISIILLLSGCSKEKKNPSSEGQSSEKEQQSEKIPDDLKEIEENIEKIISSLDGPAVGIRKEESKDSTQGTQGTKVESTDKKEGETNQEAEKKDEKKKEDEKEKEGNKEEGETKKGDSEGKSSNKDVSSKTQQKDPWEKITPIINKMHYTWNSYMPQALKKGANQKVLDDFSNALNNLTNTIITKNKENTLIAANYLYTYIPDLFSIYKTRSPSEIKRIRYYARNAILNSLTSNWKQAELDMDNLKSTWMILRNVINKENQDSINKLDLSITELEKVVKSENKQLADIKGRIALANIEEIEKSLEDTGGKMNSQSGS